MNPQMIDTGELARLRELLNEATRGPWFAYFGAHGDPRVVASLERPLTTVVAGVASSPDDYGRSDAELIAELRNAAPWLLACAEALQRVRELHSERPNEWWAEGDTANDRWQPTECSRCCTAWPCDTIRALDGEAKNG
jgi:hypothetical protein